MFTKEPKKLRKLLTDTSLPKEMRLQVMTHALMAGDEVSQGVIVEILDAVSSGDSKDELALELANLKEQLMEGPLRSATFFSLIESKPFGRRAQVRMHDGTDAYSAVFDDALARELRCGDTVMLEAQGKAVLSRLPDLDAVGEVARLERQLAGGEVEVTVGELGRFVYRASAHLLEQLESGEARPGSTVIACPRRMMAFRAVPPQDGLAHFRFLTREPVPDVLIERDVGSPPEFLTAFENHLRRELDAPRIGMRYRARRSCLQLLAGVPGSGKTYSIQAFWNRMYAVMSERIGVPVEDLPPRVMHLRPSDVLSKWLGSSDKNITRFFEEADQLAGQTFEGPDGAEYELPLLIVCEEIEALARQRGNDGIHDRIQVSLLGSFDPARSIFSNRLVFVICTTNAPHLMDTAFTRRAAGSTDTFGRLDRTAFKAVLEKQLRERPFRRSGAGTEAEARRRAVDDLTAWLYAAADAGQVELTYVGRPNADTKLRRDFLTAALVDRAVQQACNEACNDEWLGATDPGLSTELLARTLDRQVRSIVELLTPENARNYLALPDGVRVGNVHRLDQPNVLPFELERAS